METIASFFNVLFWIFLVILITGLIKPWTVLWFLDLKNRKYVLTYYGNATLLLLVIKILLSNLV